MRQTNSPVRQTNITKLSISAGEMYSTICDNSGLPLT